ncbi:hypothetical protein V1279_003008 [Bradyrhizobium sp. AZCC 1610]|uniref:hypothetical protein n=1 Tax=Bradyrhizobium sp. AZCC 1610 TaxID=3117020 RepID=UPI002FEFCD09
MRNRLLHLYQTYSCRSGITPSQSAVLAEAACVLGSRGIPADVVRNTVEDLESAFEIGIVIPSRPVFSGFISELSRA